MGHDAPDASPGIHHVTAIAGDPAENAGFYAGTLGLRLVKRTVNHDDPDTYHLYYGDGAGSPGTTVTFFPWGEDGPRGQFGTGQVQTTSLLVPGDAVGYWVDRLTARDVAFDGPIERFDETVLRCTDPDGIRLELVARDDAPAGHPWSASPVPEDRQVRGIDGVTLALAEREPTAELLVEAFGYEHAGSDGGRHRYRSGEEASGEDERHASVVDLVVRDDVDPGRQGVGTVHHVAFVAADAAEQVRWRDRLRARGLRVTDVVDRVYFTSIYFRTPGGVLFEIATLGPGFTADEPLDDLGSRLALPPWLEEDREAVEAALPAFEVPDAVGGSDAETASSE